MLLLKVAENGKDVRRTIIQSDFVSIINHSRNNVGIIVEVVYHCAVVKIEIVYKIEMVGSFQENPFIDIVETRA